MVRDIVITALGFSVGVAAVAAYYHARAGEWWYVAARGGYAVSLGLLLEALAKAPVIPATWRTWLFVVACIVTAVGFTMVARDTYHRQHRGRYL